MKDIIYISGAITDRYTGQPREGWEQDFNLAAERINELGFKVLNPVKISKDLEVFFKAHCSDTEIARVTYLLEDLNVINENAEHIAAIYVIGNYMDVVNSAGVMAECALARTLGIPVIIDNTGMTLLTYKKREGEPVNPPRSCHIQMHPFVDTDSTKVTLYDLIPKKDS